MALRTGPCRSRRKTGLRRAKCDVRFRQRSILRRTDRSTGQRGVHTAFACGRRMQPASAKNDHRIRARPQCARRRRCAVSGLQEDIYRHGRIGNRGRLAQPRTRRENRPASRIKWLLSRLSSLPLLPLRISATCGEDFRSGGSRKFGPTLAVELDCQAQQASTRFSDAPALAVWDLRYHVARVQAL